MLSLFKTLLVYAALLGSAALGQSLSILKKQDANFAVQVNAGGGAAQTLQSSANLRLWFDVVADAPDQFSKTLTNDWFPRLFFRLTPTPPEAPPIRVLVIGDSLSADCCGWGQGLYGYFKQNATVVNYAQPQMTTKSFLQSQEYNNMLLIKPDYVLISFGGFDGSGDPDRGTTLTEFQDNLRTIAQAVRGFNGVPVFVTLHAARLWDAQGRLLPTSHPYIPAMKQVATEIGVHLVDLDALSRELFTKLGPDGCAFMHFEQGGSLDVMHFSPLGAVYVAQLVVNALPDDIGPYLTGILEPPPKP